MSKEIILHYCKTVQTHDIEHLQNAIENARYIENGDYKMLNGCPGSYGVVDHIGLCEVENVDSYTEKEKIDMCNRCWKQILENDE